MNDQAPASTYDSTPRYSPARSGGRGELAAVLAGAALLAITLTFPFVTQMTHVGRVDNFDGDFGIWNVAWVARTLVVHPTRVLDANIFYPRHGTLVYSETNLGAGALAIPAYWATHNPYFAFNFVFLLSLVLGAAGAYYLVRHLVGDRRAAVVSGICFGFCPYVFGRTPQMQLLMTAGLPFSMLAFHRVADRPTARRGVVLGVVMAAQVLFCGYYAVFVMLMVSFATLAVAGTRRLWTNAAYWRAIALAAGVGFVAALPILIPYMQLQRNTGFGRALVEANRFSADWQAYFASSAVAHRWMQPLLGHWNEVLFPGFVALVGGVAGLVLGLRGDKASREAAIVYGALGAVACWASFGPQAGLYTVLYRTLPPFSLMRAPSRFGVVVTLALSVLAGIAVRDLLARVARPAIVGAAVAVVAAIELAFPLHFREVPPVSPAYTLLRTLPAGPVIELPFYTDRRDLFGHARYMMGSTAHWMPLVNGYSDYIPPDYLMEAPALKTFPSGAAFAVPVVRLTRYAVFHLDLIGGPERAAVEERIAAFGRYLRPLYKDNDTELYEIVGVPPS